MRADDEFLPQSPRGNTFEGVHQRGHGHLRRVFDQQVHVVVLTVALDQYRTEACAYLREHGPESVMVSTRQDRPPIFGDKDQVNVQRENDCPAASVVIFWLHRPTCYGRTVKLRYRYRAYPTPSQVQMLARTFGCARVVFNDALRARQDAYAAGEKVSDTEVQRRVVTLAKSTPQREWLGEVASVVLVQACQDARMAYRNWFDSLAGKRKGRKVGHPRFRSRKDNRQAIRLTRNGFGVTATGVRVAKVGNIRLEWSRELPSIPSSVTMIQEADGRYYASFVVQTQDQALPAATTEVGIDLGLTRLATLSTGEVIANPRHLRRTARALARSQRSLARKVKGSNNRRKAVKRVAVLHRKVRETRLDGHHKLALRLIRENQAVHIEDLNIAGLGKSNLAKSVHDAGWAILIGLLQEKADRYGRQVVKVGRWFPSSQLCGVCGVKDGPKPLAVRTWTCRSCGAAHDRDVNAARNILVEGLRVAAGLADTKNACGADVRPGPVLAVGREAGTRRSAA